MSCPCIEDWGSITFGANKELSIRKISEYLPKEEFFNCLEKIQKNGMIYGVPLGEERALANEDNKAYRMSYSRIMMCKKWEVMDSLLDEELSKRWHTSDRGGNYARSIHEKYVNVIPQRDVRWLNKDIQECEKLI